MLGFQEPQWSVRLKSCGFQGCGPSHRNKLGEDQTNLASHSLVWFVTFTWSYQTMPHITKILKNIWLTLVYKINVHKQKTYKNHTVSSTLIWWIEGCLPNFKMDIYRVCMNDNKSWFSKYPSHSGKCGNLFWYNDETS